jgi:hypothetical protein
VGRLDNIIARNRRPNRLQERVIVSTMLGAIVLLIIVLAVFTDLGLPPDAGNARDAPAGRQAPAAPTPARTRQIDGKRVDGILLRRPPAARTERQGR